MTAAPPGQHPPPVWPRLPLLAVGVATLVSAVLAGLVRAGWPIELPQRNLPALHGPLMATGFLGVVIGLERAVGLGRPWGYLAPVAAALACLAAVTGLPLSLALPLFSLAAAGLVAVQVQVLRLAPQLHNALMLAGAALLLAGNAQWWAGQIPAQVEPWWAGFLILTIAAERLELNRLTPPSPARLLGFLAAVALLVAGLVAETLGWSAGTALRGLGVLLIAAWLLRFDIARRTVRLTGLTRFVAVCLLAGYAWLGVGGALLLAHGAPLAGLQHDAQVHAVLLGFVFSMIFGHAPIIFPAILRVAVPYHPLFWGHVALLHTSVALRVAGDLAEIEALRRWGSLGNAAAIALFFAATVAAVVRGRRSRGKLGNSPSGSNSSSNASNSSSTQDSR